MEKENKFVLWFDEIGIKDVGLVGGKNASLGEMYRSLVTKGVNVPGGFAITAYAYKYLIKKTGIENKIIEILSDLDVHDMRNLQDKGKKIRKIISSAEFPEELEEAILEAYHKMLKEDKDIKAVFTQLVETSTGVVYDVKGISSVVNKSSAVLVVDAISGLGAQTLFTDEWGVDVVVAGSQKGLMLPPGLSFVSLSTRAWQLVDNASLPRYYWDFKKAKKSLDKKQTPYTPAVSLICALKESLRLIKEEGWENVINRHSVLARATREAISALGLSIFGHPASNVLTSVLVPSGVNEKELRKKMQDKYGVLVAGGQAKLSGKIIRIAHLGWMDSLDVITAISALEMSLKDLGYRINLGEGVRAAEEVLRG